MKHYLYWCAVAVALLLSACSGIRGGIIAGGEFDMRGYQHVAVGVLPVAVNLRYQSAALPLDEIRKSVLSALHQSPLRLADIQLIDAEVSFPLTPGRLREIAVSRHLAAAVGISISSWSRPLAGSNGRALTDMTIVFADTSDHEKRWLISRVWGARSIDRLPDTLDSQLFPELLDLRDWLTHRDKPIFGSRGAAIEDPLVTISSADLPQRRGPADKNKLPQVNAKYLRTVVTAINDEGLDELQISNAATNWSVSTQGIADVSGAKPISLGNTVQVPLAYGKNVVVATARRGTHATTQQVDVESTQPASVAVLAIGGGGFPAPNGTDNSWLAAEQVYTAALIGPPSGSKLLAGPGLSIFDLYQAATEMNSKVGAQDQLIVYVAGQLAVRDEKPLITLVRQDAVPDRGRGPSGIDIQDLQMFTKGRRAVALLDVCAPDDQVEASRSILARALPANERFVAEVKPCSKGVGDLSAVAAQWSRQAATVSGFSRWLGSKPDVATLFDAVVSTRAGTVAAADGSKNTASVQTNAGGSPSSSPGRAPASAPTSAPPDDTANSATTTQATPSAGDPAKSYYVIAMSFQSLDLARKTAQTLANQGYESEVIQSSNGIYGVSVGRYPTKDLAARMRAQIVDKGAIATDSFILPPERWSGIVR